MNPDQSYSPLPETQRQIVLEQLEKYSNDVLEIKREMQRMTAVRSTLANEREIQRDIEKMEKRRLRKRVKGWMLSAISAVLGSIYGLGTPLILFENGIIAAGAWIAGWTGGLGAISTFIFFLWYTDIEA